MTKDLYKVLDVDKSASQTEIKKGYRAKAKLYHPDKNPGDKGAESNFKDVAYAYEVLSDEDKKSKYDTRGHAGLNNQHQGHGNAQSMFEEMMRQQQEQAQKAQYDINVAINITLEEAYNGTSKKFQYNRQVKCKPCKGYGGSNPTQCPSCHGAGHISHVIQTPVGRMTQQVTCDHCHGKGRTYKDTCSTCRGKGLSNEKKEVTIDIPHSPTEPILKPNGGHMIPNGTFGTLTVRVDVQAHPKFRPTYAYGLISDIQVPYEILMTGGKVEFQTIDGSKVKLTIKKLSKIGSKVKLAQKGLKDPIFKHTRGDQFLVLHVDIPNSMTTEEEELLNKIKKLKE
jgi:molecular chaperone DnaJ